ncbi:polyprenyl synthetase family protein [Paracnuella aquatica]|uniref:polyprenyl synthetase family protein n=1 Tax=Paracnuella aquatica TaxID=2268757 RepID=UPI000DEF1137|nr:polyprenyl synthetase family protein [Paracnuella aquatica]RPD51363.1 polyprenyl synthetase family protein [Paracnuella aquatica]
MQTFEQLSSQFTEYFQQDHFPQEPATLYQPNRYFLQLGGKRVRPVGCLMGNELFDNIVPDAWKVATAIELFHNFTLIHDDIMDRAPLRRGMPTVHHKYGESTALLAGDVMLVAAYENLRKISPNFLVPVLGLFNKTAREVCEGQQLDMDFEQRDDVTLDEYEHMISLKTSVLMAGSLKLGAILGGASKRNQDLIYEFGRKVGLAFQVQDDYLDAFGDPEKFGKQVGGDIKANKKTFLLIHALQTADKGQRESLQHLMLTNSDNKVDDVLQLFRQTGVDQWARELQDNYLQQALQHLEDIAVTSSRKEPLRQLALYLVQREH